MPAAVSLGCFRARVLPIARVGGAYRVMSSKIEKGDPKVNMGSYALALYVLGKIDDLEKLIDRTNDPLGLDMMDERLPKRIRVAK